MKKVDSNYSYDELEGFETVKVRERLSNTGFWLSMRGRIFSISYAARMHMGGGYLRVSLNRDRHLLLIEGCEQDFLGSIHVSHNQKSAVSCAGLRKILEKECRYDLDIVRIRIPGQPAKSRKNAVIFDLSKAVTEKPERKK